MTHTERVYKYDETDQTVSYQTVTGETKTDPYKVFYARAFVVAHMSLKGVYRSFLDWSQRLEVWKLADGFGPWDEDLARYMADGWDWSHIRDSSNQAFVTMAEYIIQVAWARIASLDAQVERIQGYIDERGLCPCHILPTSAAYRVERR